MIVSHSLQFIFLKPFKVGGTSVLQSLATKCQNGDLISAVFLEPDDLDQFSTSNLTLLPQHRIKEKPRAKRFSVNTSLNTHALPGAVSDTIGSRDWDRLFKFTIIRNPWDLMLSFRRMKLLNPDGYMEPAEQNFEVFVNQFDFTRLPPPYNENPINDCWYFDPASGKTLVDAFVRFEKLQSDFNAICERLQIPITQLPHMQKKASRSHYSAFYNAATRERVARLFARSIEYFGYTFD